VTGEGLDRALGGVDVAYFLIHSMEPSADGRSARASERPRRTSPARRGRQA